MRDALDIPGFRVENAPDTEFGSVLGNLVKALRPEICVETGTLFGTGSTTCIGEALPVGGVLFTIECNAAHIARARPVIESLNQRIVGRVMQCHGLSIPRSRVPTETALERMFADLRDEDIIADFREWDRAKKYIEELKTEGPDDHLGRCIRDYDVDFILLDSAGGIGLWEFTYVLEQLTHECVIALDDTHHVKHFLSLKAAYADKRCEIMMDMPAGHGYAVIRFRP